MRSAAPLVCLFLLGACATAPADAPPGAVAPHAVRSPAPQHMPAAGPAPSNAGAAEAARRLYTVADTVMIRGAALCEGRLKPSVGMRVWNSHIPGSRGEAPARQSASPATVFTVVKEGPAARAGLVPGDQITTINGLHVPTGPSAMEAYGAALEAALGNAGPITFAYRREGREATASVIPVPACDYRVVFANSPIVNAATDGQSVLVMRGLVNLLSRDEELALVVGHELGHNVLGHFARGRALGHQAAYANPRGPQLASLRAFEREADYVGVYFVALAGYDYMAAIESSRRMAAIGPPPPDRANSTHPSQNERYQILAAAVREIRAKLAEGGLLRPNLATGRDMALEPVGSRPAAFGR